MKIQGFEMNDKGIQRIYGNEKWTVGIKNWEPANDITGLDCLERYNKIDGLSVLLSGRCTLISTKETDGELKVEALEMEPFRVYNIPQSLWHNTVTQKDTKMILIEGVFTSMENSDILDLTPAQIETSKSLVK